MIGSDGGPCQHPLMLTDRITSFPSLRGMVTMPLWQVIHSNRGKSCHFGICFNIESCIGGAMQFLFLIYKVILFSLTR